MLGLAILLVVTAGAGLAAWGYLYVRFLRSPARVWRDRVLRLEALARTQARAARAQAEALKHRQEAEENGLRHRAWDAFLRAIPVAELEAFPGIGPATIARLHSAGYSDLAALSNLRVNVSGLGEKRMADVRRAVAELVRQSRNRFEGGSSPEARSLTAALSDVRARAGREQADLRDRLRAAESVLRDLDPFVPAARRVTFLRSLTGGGRLVPEAQLHVKLPDLAPTMPLPGRTTAAPLSSRDRAAPDNGPAPGVAPASDPRALLEIENGTPLSADLIRRRYYLLVGRLAPDKVEELGPEFAALAAKKRAAVRTAAETLLRPFGEPLEISAVPAPPSELRHNPDLDAAFGA